jgi:DNA-binding beta-propeller fold protein YncE
MSGVALPGAAAPASLDYIAVDRAAGRVWVPVGNTGSVDVFDIEKGSFTRVDGFATAEREGRNGKRTVGPSAVSLGGGSAYIGNRATNEVCAVDTASLRRGTCVKLTSGTDGVVYAASVKEVWVTTPDVKTLEVLDASHAGTLKPKTKVKLEGEPEGYAVDEKMELFFTNLEDEGSTIVIDMKTHRPIARWNAGCGKDGPRGLAFDAARGFLFVACTDHVQVLDTGHDGARLGMLDTGAGVDNLDYLEAKGLLYAAAGKDARISVISVDDQGR